MQGLIDRRSAVGARVALAAALIAACGTAAGAAPPRVQWHSGTAEFAPMQREQVRTTLADLAVRADRRHMVVQFDGPVSQLDKARLAAGGLRLLSYLGDFSYFAAPAEGGLDAAALSNVDALVGARPIETQWKTHALIAQDQWPAWSIVGAAGEGDAVEPVVAAYVMFHADVDHATTGVAIAEAHGADVKTVLRTVNALVIEAPKSVMTALLDDDAVQWLEPPLPQFSEMNDSNRARTEADVLQAAPYGLDGSGVSVMVYDAGTGRASHNDFGGRLTARDGSGNITHATHVAGTIGGSGAASGGTFRGMAPGVTIESYGFQWSGGGTFLYTNPGDFEGDYDQAINVHGVDIANNSIGTNTATNGFPCSITGDYGLMASLIDGVVGGSLGEPFRIVWANGNERQSTNCGNQYNTTAPPAGAKNHITVGALNSNNDTMTSFSSWGPVDDGRIKPDIAAPGCQSNGDGGVTSTSNGGDSSYTVSCGTSMAAPTVTGVAALIMQDYLERFPGLPEFRNSTLKALLAHTAEDVFNPGPDFMAGYGSIRGQRAIDFMRTGAFLEDTAGNGVPTTYTVTVDPGQPELRLTLAWDDLPGTPNVVPSLVNDLDLRVFDPMGNRHFPWTLNPASPATDAVRTQEDHLNNIEQVLVSSPMPGEWTVEVFGFNVPGGSQVYSLLGGPGWTTTAIVVNNEAPDLLAPGTSVTFDVEIVSVNESTIPGSAQMHYRFAPGAYTTIPLTSLGGTMFEGVLPGAVCGQIPEWWFSVEATETGMVTNPLGAPINVYTTEVGEIVIAAEDDLEVNSGWTAGAPGDSATTGVWTRVDPVGTSAQPEDDHTTGGTMCFVTGQGSPGGGLGDNDVDGGFTTLLSPNFDATGIDGAVMSYWRWYSNNTGAEPNSEVFRVDVSNDGGGSWTSVEVVGPGGAETNGGWRFHEFLVEDFVTPTSQVRLRFIAEDAAGNGGSLVEAAVDDLQLRSGVQCESACPADLNGDGLIDGTDLAQLLGEWGDANAPSDLTGDGVTDGSDLGVLLGQWGPCA